MLMLKEGTTTRADCFQPLLYSILLSRCNRLPPVSYACVCKSVRMYVRTYERTHIFVTAAGLAQVLSSRPSEL